MSLTRILILAPVVLFVALTSLLFVRLYAGDPSKVPSALQNKPVPEFALEALPGLSGENGPVPGFDTASLKTGEVTLVNVWASWCIPCRDEHPYIDALSQDPRFRMFGLNYKDQPDNARRFLGRYGNPFDAVGVDRRGRTGIDWGVYGVPETFIVDGEGRIVFKYIGPINQAILDEVMLPEIEKALEANKAAPDVPAVGS
jgi:cytochrome c biogenesis protein CcmG/thiol:disulfide interchange protein DsbE